MNERIAGGNRQDSPRANQGLGRNVQTVGPVSDKGQGASNAAMMKAKLAGLTASQIEEQKAAMFGLFITEKRRYNFVKIMAW